MSDDVDQLFTLAPEEFIAARDALAKASPAPDRVRVKALRRPTVGAWLVNQLVRARREAVEDLLTLGAELRRAQQAGRADVLRSLGSDRRALTDELVAAAADLATQAGRTVTADLLAAVSSSLDAAVADAGLAEQLRRATLTEPLSYAGFGAFGLSTVPDLAPDRPARGTGDAAGQGTKEAPTRTGPTSRERAAAERERVAAERAAAAQLKRVEEATAALAAAHDQRRSAEDLLRLSEHALSDARMGLDLAKRAEQKAQELLDKARRPRA
ncbi:MAG: hypothetical protein QOG52_328 [Frankiaceae bacterium]|jgi:uncharacterized protein YjiS (DUF1127 family)|nr:hypothetical protein [Frankiaceae bacterium]